MNLLIVEDEPRMLELLYRGLNEEGHVVMCAHDGAEGLSMIRQYPFDVIILDVMMPKADGFQVLRLMRAESNRSAVIMLTAKDTVSDVVRGLDLGADDYLTKPFSFEELIARLRTVSRRVHHSTKPELQVADLVLNRAEHEVSRGGELVTLTRTEYSLLEQLMYRAGMVIARRLLIETVWGMDCDVEQNNLDAFMHLLRSKIDRPGLPKLIHTVRGVGYVIRESARS